MLDLEFVKGACAYIEQWHHQFDPLPDSIRSQAEEDVDFVIDLCRKLVTELERVRRAEVTPQPAEYLPPLEASVMGTTPIRTNTVYSKANPGSVENYQKSKARFIKEQEKNKRGGP